MRTTLSCSRSPSHVPRKMFPAPPATPSSSQRFHKDPYLPSLLPPSFFLLVLPCFSLIFYSFLLSLLHCHLFLLLHSSSVISLPPPCFLPSHLLLLRLSSDFKTLHPPSPPKGRSPPNPIYGLTWSLNHVRMSFSKHFRPFWGDLVMGCGRSLYRRGGAKGYRCACGCRVHWLVGKSPDSWRETRPVGKMINSELMMLRRRHLNP